MNFEMYAKLLTAATGVETFETPDNLLQIGERIICMERCFNVREGFKRKADSLPAKMVSESLRNAGPATGQVVKNLAGMLDEYYQALGYTKNGVPSIDKLKELGIELNQKDV